ncbi:hypothetical protein [Staphylococcus chromogenes]|uniref:hypothetical protein n=2 Tax=Staphylococcus TaxID=1279 RepID=UPI0028859B20|nr:hypothetical protein [Staphylococcus chromogenes]MDT0656351.1 hypothetical protein [Staphylococcus chromogenes]MDT0672745.1 hypothetical protein [Staphylococcus chromogenes]MDT0674939.1 hypothetical protein [Staphylococcus chromogenes]MDT0699115.1 hypothetical protein [Staphylococcus chromogenes]
MNNNNDSLLNKNRNRTSNYENTMLDTSERYSVLPAQSLRVKGVVHSKAVALKRYGLYDNLNDILEEALEKLIEARSDREKEFIRKQEREENEQKLRRLKSKNKS